MIGRAGTGRALSRPSRLWAETSTGPEDAAREDRAILSFTLLLSVLISGFVISLQFAEASPALTSLFASFTH